MPNYDHRFKIGFIPGASTEVGLFIQHFKNQDSADINSNNLRYNYAYIGREINNQQVQFHIGGIEEECLMYRKQRELDACVVCFDMSRTPDSISSRITAIIQSRRNYFSEIIFILGLNSDSANELWTQGVLDDLAKKNDSTCYTVSTKTGEGCEQLLTGIGNELIERAQLIDLHAKVPEPVSRGSCGIL